jgi:hypothetical protein
LAGDEAGRVWRRGERFELTCGRGEEEARRGEEEARRALRADEERRGLGADEERRARRGVGPTVSSPTSTTTSRIEPPLLITSPTRLAHEASNGYSECRYLLPMALHALPLHALPPLNA